jgi:RNA polymerase sigma-70 factor (sigma-E family)
MPRTRDAEFSAFVTTARAGLLHTAFLLTAGNQHLAEDLVQTTLTRLYVAWPRVLTRPGPAAYARRTLVNAFLDETRRPYWKRERTTSAPPEQADPATEHGLVVHAGVDGAAVRAALRQLPPQMRAVVVLRHWLDLSVEDTATALRCTSGTVKSQNARALAKLRDLLPAPTADSLGGHHV